MYFPLDKLLNYTGNRYQLARACMEYARRARYIDPEEYEKMGEKEALIALKHLLEGDVQFTADKFEVEIYEDEAEVIVSQMEEKRRLEQEAKKAREIEAAEKEESILPTPKPRKRESKIEE